MTEELRRDAQLTEANKDDWGKLLRVLKYLNGTKLMKLTLEVDTLSTLNWCIDASHQVHDNCKGHTGGALTPDSRKGGNDQSAMFKLGRINY